MSKPLASVHVLPGVVIDVDRNKNPIHKCDRIHNVALHSYGYVTGLYSAGMLKVQVDCVEGEDRFWLSSDCVVIP